MKRSLNILAITFLASAICRGGTIDVTPANVGTVAASAPGSTFSFAPGTYVLPLNPKGPAENWPAGTYIGNGAIITLAGGNNDTGNAQLVQFGSGSDVSGFTFTDSPILCAFGSFNIHGNTFSNTWRGIQSFAEANSHFDGNTFTNLTSEGIYGTPANGNTYSNNTFDNVFEPIHLVPGSCTNITVSNNKITRAQRFGIELQNAISNLNVSNNSLTQWLALGNLGVNTQRCGISCATGGGKNVTITNNLIAQDHFPGSPVYGPVGSAIEIIADGLVTISGNTYYNWGGPYLNGVRKGGGLSISNNTIYGPAGDPNGQDPVDYPVEKPYLNPTDKVLPLASYQPPTTAPATAPTSVLPAPTPAPAVTHTISVSIDGTPVLQKQVLSDGSVK